ncbi:MAG: hypothetical protein J7J51_05300 [Candidatus Omnitrophica bacterium]|nr:hypothetical protein [Candidatus Omnitrophota bacterium]
MGVIVWKSDKVVKCSVCGQKVTHGLAYVVVWRTVSGEEYVVDVVHKKCWVDYIDKDGYIPARHGLRQIAYLCRVKGVIFELYGDEE